MIMINRFLSCFLVSLFPTSLSLSLSRYIKPHGALYHAVMAGGAQGEAVVEAARLLELPLLLMPRSEWATYGEGFAERAYVTWF